MKRAAKIAGISLLAFIAMTLVLTAIAASRTSPKAVISTPPVTDTSPVCSPDTSQLLNLINTERISVGSPVLIEDPTLDRSASNKLNDEETNEYYGHNMLDGGSWSTFIRAEGVNAAASEDLDENALTPSDDWNAFKNSPAHYASLTDSQYTRVGIAEQCTDFTLQTGTGPDDNSNLVGQKIQELTVVHLAANEPVVQAVHYGTECADGTFSSSTGRGTCSWHGGEL